MKSSRRKSFQRIVPVEIFGRRRRGRPGTPPGLMDVDPDARASSVHVIAYGPDSLEEHDIESIDDIEALRARYPVVWVNVDGLGDIEALRRIGEVFALHPLALEDVVHTPQRAKMEEYEGEIFVIMHMAHASATDASFELEQLSLFLGRGFVVTFQEHTGDSFDAVRGRLREGRRRIRAAGADYLAYALIDAAIDSMFPILEALDERLSTLDEEAMFSVERHMAQRIKAVKRQVHFLYRGAYPVRDAVVKLQREDRGLIGKETKLYLRDCYDHAVQAIDLLQDARELASDLTDLHQATLGNRLNDIMKFLTVFSTIFIPLSFIAGLYGMNFDPGASRWNMPELAWTYGYPFALGLMAAVAGFLLVFFRRKGWLGSDDS